VVGAEQSEKLSALRLGCEAHAPARRLLHRHERILRPKRVRHAAVAAGAAKTRTASIACFSRADMMPSAGKMFTLRQHAQQLAPQQR
jgi:hypothetical protein